MSHLLQIFLYFAFDFEGENASYVGPVTAFSFQEIFKSFLSPVSVRSVSHAVFFPLPLLLPPPVSFKTPNLVAALNPVRCAVDFSVVLRLPDSSFFATDC